MKKEMEIYLDKRYQDICDKYNTAYQIELKNLSEELVQKGQINSGIAELRKFELVRKNLNGMVGKFEELLTETQKEFKRKIADKDIRDYIDRSIKTINQYIDDKEKAMIENIVENNLSSVDSLKLRFDNLKGNMVFRLKDFNEKLSLINTGQKIDINIILTVISLIISAIGLVATIIFGILSLF